MKTILSKIVKTFGKIGTTLVSWEKPESLMTADEFIAYHHRKNFPHLKSCQVPQLNKPTQVQKSKDDLEDSNCLVLA